MDVDLGALRVQKGVQKSTSSTSSWRGVAFTRLLPQMGVVTQSPSHPKKRAWPQPSPSPNCYKPLPRWVSIDPCVIQEARGTSQGPAQIIAPPTGGRGQTALPDPPPDSLPGGGALTDEVGGFGGHEKVGQVEPLDERRVDGQRPAPAPRVVCGEGRGGTE